jgi:phospholipase C
VSPRIPRNTIDHRLYDHSSIPATLAAAFDLKPLTDRDAAANNLLSLLSLPVARTDAPLTLPDHVQAALIQALHPSTAPSTPDMIGSVDAGSLPLRVQVVMRHDLALSPASDRHAILARAQAIQTRQQAADYIEEIRSRIQNAHANISD